jgi:hypothetical protein
VKTDNWQGRMTAKRENTFFFVVCFFGGGGEKKYNIRNRMMTITLLGNYVFVEGSNGGYNIGKDCVLVEIGMR